MCMCVCVCEGGGLGCKCEAREKDLHKGCTMLLKLRITQLLNVLNVHIHMQAKLYSSLELVTPERPRLHVRRKSGHERKVGEAEGWGGEWKRVFEASVKLLEGAANLPTSCNRNTRLSHFVQHCSIRGASPVDVHSTVMCLTCHHKSMRMEQLSVLEEGKCANSCVHEYKYLVHSAWDYSV